MSYISDYKHGYLDDDEYRQIAAEENRRDRWESEHEYDDVCDDKQGDDDVF